MKRIIMLMGPPASGKTTRANEILKAHREAVRVNQDDIRRDLGWKGWETWDFKGPLEKSVYGIKLRLIEEALRNPLVQIVISDDTNLKPERRAELEKIAKMAGAFLAIERFDTPLEECLRRDATRPAYAQVGEKVIRRMHAEMEATRLPMPPRKVEHIPGLPNVIICDLDGTLADHENRRDVYDFAQCANDALKPATWAVISAMVSHVVPPAYFPTQLIYMSGREDRFRPETEQFLGKHNCPKAPLYMRPTGDRRADQIVKTELFNQHVRGKFNVLFCLDDRDRVVKMWRDMGLTCLQVAPGAF